MLVPELHMPEPESLPTAASQDAVIVLFFLFTKGELEIENEGIAFSFRGEGRPSSIPNDKFEFCCEQEELKSLESIPPASRSCKEVVDFVTGNVDPLIPTSLPFLSLKSELRRLEDHVVSGNGSGKYL
ncbi:hypothetical protein SASPL_152751 [Salvia splendens]|uniref:Uncharacterized protein n=1 Tax=Salvia splendens TaxID=180675 RepID=A0A8X8W477_SALSN|nr:hypothetical protein SASPL_152751 [Salvia splendens]